jgi:hypothetical protein
LPILASCQSEPENPNSFEYFRWYNDNYQWGTDKKGSELSLDECAVKMGNANKETISSLDVFLNEWLKIRMFEKQHNDFSKIDTYLVYFPLEADFYPLPYDIDLKLNVIRWNGKVDCGYRDVFNGIIVVKSVQKVDKNDE